jgi:hypothetical protein
VAVVLEQAVPVVQQADSVVVPQVVQVAVAADQVVAEDNCPVSSLKQLKIQQFLITRS